MRMSLRMRMTIRMKESSMRFEGELS